MRTALAVAVAVALVIGGAAATQLSGTTVVLPAGADVGAAATAHPGGVLQLSAGRYGPFTLTVPVTVLGGPDVVVAGPVRVAADRVTLRDLLVEGGATGVSMREVDGVVLAGVRVRGAELHGIEVVDASATITDCTVGGLTDPYAQGIEVRNAAGRPRTVIAGCAVATGQEGIVAHVSRVEFVGNTVTDTTMRAIAVTEMSEGVVAGNTVRDVTGSGLYCGDMSNCEVRDNTVEAVADDGSGIRSRSGQAALVWYHSTMRLVGNRFDADSTHGVDAFNDGTLTDAWPLALWPPGWRGAAGPGLVVLTLSLGGLALLSRIAVGVRRRRARPVDSAMAGPGSMPTAASAALLTAFAVQTFHMLEHGVQVWQNHVAQAERRNGLLGAVADGEWVHWVFNVAVLAFVLLAWREGRNAGGFLHGRAATARAGILTAVVVIQSYHVVEHSVRLVQFLRTGLDPAPGLVGGRVDVVWFHFGVNLAVWAGSAAAIGWPLAQAQITLWRSSRKRRCTVPAHDSSGLGAARTS